MRDVRSADVVTVADRGQALNVGAQQSGKSLCLGLAQLRKLGRDVGDRAVMLAQLLPYASGGSVRGSGVTICGQCLSENR